MMEKSRLSTLFRLRATRSHKKIIEHMEFDLVTSRKVHQTKLRILDIGAHIGEVLDILKDSNHRHEFHVVAVEPLERNLKKLKSKARHFSFLGYGKVDVIPYAIGENEETEFYLGQESTLFTSSKLWMQRFPENFREYQSIEIQSRDFFSIKKDFGYIDFNFFDIVKIDTEGNDIKTLLKLSEAGIQFDAIIIEFDSSSIFELERILRTLSCREIYVFVREGISTRYIGHLNHDTYLRELLLKNPKISGNLVAFPESVKY